VIKQSAQVGWLAGGEYFVCDAVLLQCLLKFPKTLLNPTTPTLRAHRRVFGFDGAHP